MLNFLPELEASVSLICRQEISCTSQFHRRPVLYFSRIVLFTSRFAARTRCETVCLAFFSRCITFCRKDFQNGKGAEYLNTISRHPRKLNTNEQTDSKLERNGSTEELVHELRPTQGENFARKLLHITSSAT